MKLTDTTLGQYTVENVLTKMGYFMKKNKLVHGVGITDVDYVVHKFETIGYVDGKRKQKLIWFYLTWQHMLQRGYSSKYKEKRPTYKDCFVNKEWHLFSNFKSWMQEQKLEDKEGNKLQLDKDILFEGNKEYSKEKCIFVPRYINTFITDRGAERGEWPIGVCWYKASGKFQALCNNGKGKQIHLGYFNDPQEAHLTWKTCKHKLALQYADELAKEGYDSRLVEALKVRYL